MQILSFSLSLSLSLSIYLSIYLSICLSIYSIQDSSFIRPCSVKTWSW